MYGEAITDMLKNIDHCLLGLYKRAYIAMPQPLLRRRHNARAAMHEMNYIPSYCALRQQIFFMVVVISLSLHFFNFYIFLPNLT